MLTPASTLAALTIQMPLASTCVENQELLVSTTQAVSSLTVNVNGGAGVGLPTSLSAGGFFRIRFEPVLKTWYRVG